MSTAIRIPDEVWESHKEAIRDLYQREDIQLKDLIRIMEESYQFRATDKQYIRRLGKWKFKKYSTSEKWQHTAQLISKRKLEGKESEVWMNGKPVSKKKLKKELARNCPSTMLPMQSAQVPGTAIASPDNVQVCTPPTIIDLEDDWFASIPDFEADVSFIASDFNSWMDSFTQNINSPITAPGVKMAQADSTFSREAQSVLSQLLGRDITPDNVEYISEISSSLKCVLIEKSQGDVENCVASLCNASPWEVSSLLLRYSIYLSSSNLINSERMDEILRWITRHKQFGVIKTLVDMKTPMTDTFASYLLVSAARLEDLDAVRRLIALGIDVNVPVRPYQTTALYEAVTNRNIRLVNILLHAGANLEASETGWASPITKAVLDGEKDLVMIFLRALGDTPVNVYGVRRQALRSAIVQDKPELVRMVLAADAPLDAYPGEETPLQCAVMEDNLEIVQILLSAGAEANSSGIKFGCNRLPIRKAASSGNVEMVQILLDFGADVNQPCCAGECDRSDFGHDAEKVDCNHYYLCLSPLQYAAENGDTEMVTVLLEAGAELNSRHQGGTPLQIAAGEKCIDLVKLLLKHYADVNIPAWPYCGRTALQSAAENGDHDIIDILIRARAEINALPAARFGVTALQAAVESQDSTLVEKLLRLGADINAPPSNVGGRTCLQIAAQLGDLKLVQKLLKLGAKINAKMGDNRRRRQAYDPSKPQPNYIGVFELLRDAGAHFDTLLSLLPTDITSNSMEIADCILSLISHSKEYLSVYLLVVAKSGTPEVMRSVLGAGADVNYQSSSGLAAIHEAVESGGAAMTITLIDAGADLNLTCEKCFDFLDGAVAVVGPLAIAASREDLKLVQLLLSSGASINTTQSIDSREITALDASMLVATSHRGNTAIYEIIIALVNAGTDLDREINGETPLTLSIRRGMKNLTALLLKCGADVNRVAKDGRTAIQAAAQDHDMETMKVLLHKGADISINTPIGEYGRTALQYAVQNGNQAEIRLLLQHGADINAPAATNYGVTALQAAAIRGSLPIIVLLLEAGAEINAPAARNGGRTALEGAAENGHLHVVLLLLENDKDKDRLEIRCRKAAKYAEEGYPIIAKFLKEYKVV